MIRVPEVRLPVCIVRLSDGRYLYASFDKYGTIGRARWVCETVRVFVGPAECLTEVPVDRAEDYADGTMTIETAQGTFSPRQFGSDSTSTWNDEKITWLD